MVALCFSALCSQSFAQDVSFESPIKTIDLRTAIDRTLKYAPGIHAAEAGLWMRAGDTLQASLIPNPLFNIAVGQMSLYSNFDDDDGNEVAYSISQLFELGGKRRARINAAEAEELAAKIDLEISVRDVYAKVVKRFIDAAAAQEAFELAEKQLQIAKNVLNTVAAKLEAGKVSAVQHYKSNAVLAAAELEYKRAKRAFNNAKQNLSFLWGQCTADFDSVSYPLFETFTPKPLSDLCLALGCNLEILKGEYEAWAAFQRIELEKARAVPDVILSAGVDHSNHFKSAALGFSLTVPIPVFDRNQGNIGKAECELSQIQFLQEQFKTELEEELVLTYELMLNAYEQLVAYRDMIIGLSHKTFDDLHSGFEEGKFEYLEVLDAQRSLFESQAAYISFLNQYHSCRAEIERILGVSSCSLNNILSDN